MLRCFNNKPESIVHSTVYCVTHACTSVYLTVCFRKGVSEIPEAKNVDISNLEDTEIDKTVRLPCAIGYVGFVRLKCGSKGWSKDGGRKCEPKSCGHPGDTPNGDFHLSILDDFVFGAQVLYQCRKGYQMVTRSRHRTCVEQGWDSALPICEALKCPVIQANDNVVVIGNSEDATYGNVIQFECQSNHMVLNGSSEMVCNDKGEWSSTVPTCKVIKCYAPDIANGAVSGPPKEDYDEDDTLRYSCNTKYVKSQERVPKCTKMVNSANWSPTPACEEVRCKLSLPPTRGTSYRPADRNLFLPDEHVMVTCASGFWNSISRRTENTMTCKEDGKWSPSTTDCERMFILESILQYDILSVLGYTQVNHCRYNCRTGFKTTNARGVATCTSDGSWTPKPLCEEIEGACIEPNVMNGFIVQSNERNVDSKIYSSCNEGFKPSTGGWWGEATCTEGTWSGILECIDQSQCGRIPVIPNTRKVPHSEVYKNEQTVTIVCKVGYTSETKTIKCKDGEWQTPLPACRRVPCDPPPKVENAIVKIPYQNKYREGFEVNYECRKSFQIEGHKKLTCENGSWTTPPPTCKQRYKNGNQIDYTCINPHKGPGGTATCNNGEWHMPIECKAKPCELPDETANGHYSIHVGDDFVFGATIKYTCNDGQIVSKMDNRTCMVAGWSNHLPICEVVSCVPEATDGRVVVSGLPDDDGVIQYGHELKFSCPNPAHQLKGNPQVVCAAGGMWNNHFPTCEDVTCEAAEKIKNVNVIGIPQNNTMKVGHRLQFECSNSKHVLKGKSEVTCSYFFDVTHVFLEPKDFCGPPPQVNNGDRDRTRERYRNGESVQYVCQKFYILDPPSAYKTCRDGIWTRPITCLKPCTVDEELMNTQNIQFKYPPEDQKVYATHGDHTTFKCTGHLRLSPGSVGFHQQCINGVMNLPHCQ
uniref:Complement factor H n=1 Tax=Oncorhynchus mykiss TaxID=8022 RepID=A0A8C7PFW1_ONCMY